jgi:hypothetical protein
MNETIAAFKSCGETGTVGPERKGLVIHLPVFDERSQRTALERRRTEDFDLGAGRDEAHHEMRADEAACPCHRHAARR